ncbi:hypothetical protein LZ32DRAFT_265467 [Colletotrichum eremochloae]|nr:hypothetical protein LZ32DRAFT_265467 [Colletotrichum eremochloae]
MTRGEIRARCSLSFELIFSRSLFSLYWPIFASIRGKTEEEMPGMEISFPPGYIGRVAGSLFATLFVTCPSQLQLRRATTRCDTEQSRFQSDLSYSCSLFVAPFRSATTYPNRESR